MWQIKAARRQVVSLPPGPTTMGGWGAICPPRPIELSTFEILVLRSKFGFFVFQPCPRPGSQSMYNPDDARFPGQVSCAIERLKWGEETPPGVWGPFSTSLQNARLYAFHPRREVSQGGCQSRATPVP
jgi:hypothetical protein